MKHVAKTNSTATDNSGVSSAEVDKVQLLKPGKQRGAVISMRLYQEVVNNILGILLDKGELTLFELLSHVKETVHREDTHWLVLQVKQDLEVRGLVKCNFKIKRSQSIKLVMSVFAKSGYRQLCESGKQLTSIDLRNGYGVSGF